MTGAQALAATVSRLRAGGLDDPPGDARRLLAHALGVAPGRLTLALPDPVPEAALTGLDAAVAERLQRRPVAQITGMRLFWGRSFSVTGDVLDPRPETETLIAAALEQPPARILDLGTGSGCILLTLLAEWPDATGLGTDVSAAALDVARRNADALGVSDRAAFAKADWTGGVTGAFDLVVSNPPYVTAAEMKTLSPDVLDWEPHGALTPIGKGMSGDGLDAYRALLPGAAALLAPSGRLLLEIGPTQAEAVTGIAARAGLRRVGLHQDLDGRDRVVALTRA